jgi:lipoprotein-releasing system permease protein
MFLSLLIGLRYTRAKRRNSFISFVSLFALLGMALGVFALIVVLSVMNGFDEELKGRILRAVPHGFLTQPEGLTDWQALGHQVAPYPFVKGYAPFVEGKGLASFAGMVRGVEIQGIDPAQEPAVSQLHAFMQVGEMQDLQPGEFGVILGGIVARYLDVQLGDRLLITLPQVSITPAGVFPRMKRFRVVGIFEVGAQLDQTLVLMHLQDAQRLFQRADRVDGLRVRVESLYSAPEQVAQLSQALGVQGRDWSHTQGNLFQAVKMEKTVVSVLLAIIIFVAAFNIVTSLVMMVTEKRSDIAVLRTMGLSARAVVAIFMVQGISMGVLGIVIGTLSGVAAALSIAPIIESIEQLLGIQVFDPEVYFVSYFPSVWLWQDTLGVVLGAGITCVLASIYPAWRAAQIAPAEALRYNI